MNSNQPCKDCDFTWAQWSGCSNLCGGTGTRERKPKIIREAGLDGKSCPMPETEKCNSFPCPPELEPESGSLVSKNFPNSYPNNLNTEDNITVSRGSIVINFTKFDTESCCDKLTVRDGDGTILLNPHSGATMPDPIQSNTNKVFVTFKTDGSSTRSGWRLTWTNKDTY